MNKKLIIALLILPLLTFSVAGNRFIRGVVAQEDAAAAAEAEAEKVEDLLDEIEEYKDKIKDLQGKADTLSQEISNFNNQIYLTELQIQNSINKIAATERKISRLAVDIDKLSDRIDIIIERIEYQEEILRERIRERYKARETTTVMVLFGSTTLDNLVKKAAYLRVMEVQDSKVLQQMRETKETYKRQKGLFEDKKEEEEVLQAQLIQEKINLDSYKLQLSQKKAEKDRLLEITQNDEDKYQDLLAEAKKELSSYSAFVTSSGQGIIGPNGLGGGEGGWYYSQRDSRWAHDYIAGSPYTVYESGCLVSSVAMVHKYYGYDMDPGDLASKDQYFFWGNMLVPWPGPGGRSYKMLGWGYPESKIDDELDDDNLVIVGITANNSAGTHFVVLIDGSDGNYEMHDPIYGPNLDFRDYYSTSQIFEAVTFD
ncbi:hypothetical protein ACFLZK_00250 [Patescibacteria group bacterium]